MKTSGNYGGNTGTDTDAWANIGGAKHQGLELAMNGDLSNQFSFSTAYTYLRARYTDYHNLAMDLDGNPATTILTTFDVTGNTIPRTSAHNLNLMLNYLATKELKLSGEVNAKSSYYADDRNAIKVNGHATLNLLATYTRKIGSFDTNFFVRVDNVLDKQYYNTARASGDRNDDGAFNAEDLSITVNPGRVFTAGMSVKF